MKKIKVKILMMLVSATCMFCIILAGCTVTNEVRDESQYSNGNVPLTDLASTYKGEATDADGNLLAPFDVVYPEAFESGDYKYDETAALLKFKKGFEGKLTSDLKSCGFTSLENVTTNSDGTVWYRAKINNKTDVKTAVKKARSLKIVLVADFDYIYEDTSTEVDENTSTSSTDVSGIIDDVLSNIQVKDQWYLTACDIQKSWRWLKSKGISAGGDPSVTVAVIDTGVDYNHPDLKANMWVNPNEIPGNGIDDDGDGYIDDVYGCSTISDERFHSGDPMDDHGHGTHVAGIIAASNNKIGIVGVAYNVKIMAIKAGQATGVFLQSDIAEAIVYAYTHGADVINMSFGGSACSIAVQDALQSAYTTSTLVASAGNDGCPNERTDWYSPLPNYPAALSYVIGVMSVNALGVESSFTNWDAVAYNSKEYEVYAPGEAILSTLPNNRYGKLNGTSMAAPIVSGIAALIRSYYTDRDMYPSKFVSAQLCATSEDTAFCFNPEKHTVVGMLHNLPMIVNAYDALTKLPKPDVNLYGYYLFDSKDIDNNNNGDGVIDAGETINIGTILRNRWGMSKNTIVTIDAIGDLGINNPYVEILTESVNFDCVGTYSTKDNLLRDELGAYIGTENPLVVKISKNCPNDYIINLNVTITYDNSLDEDDSSHYSSNGTISFAVRNGVVLPSQITEDMTLTKDNYYIIPNSTVIKEGVTVTVGPGTKIQFWSNDPKDPYADQYIAYLQVYGSLITNGTLEEPVELFPSELMARYIVTIEKQGNGIINLNYTNVVNPGLLITEANHCYFTQNFAGLTLNRKFENGKIIDNGHAWSDNRCGVYASMVQNSIFYALGGGNKIYITPNSIQTNPLVEGLFKKCMFIDSGLRYRGDFYNCVFSGARNLHEGSAKDDGSVMNIMDSNYFEGNAIINNLNASDVSYWVRPIAYKSSLNELNYIDISNNYWGTIEQELIEMQIIDYSDLVTLNKFIIDPYMISAPENTFPFVTDAYVLNSNGERCRTVSNETCTFVVEFNRDMDTTLPLRLRFGSSIPYAEYEISGSYVTPRRWEGVYTLKTTIENGNQYFNIENARAATDHFLRLYETKGRFGFEIDTTAAQAMIMQGEATETGVKLTWQQDDFDTLLGYNVYRSDQEDGLYTRLNDYVLAPNENEFFDSTIEPGKLYYYNFTVVKTDMTESTPSGKITIRAMDTMAPNIYHSPVRTAYTGQKLIISATITDNLQITSATLYFRTVGGEWKSYNMYNNNSRYYGIVGAENLSLDGLEYYIDAFDGVTHTYNGTSTKPYLVTVKVAVDDNSLGDVDGDGIITNKDALMLLQAANDKLNLTEEQFMRADINKDGILSAAEAMRILQYVSGKIGSIL